MDFFRRNRFTVTLLIHVARFLRCFPIIIADIFQFIFTANIYFGVKRKSSAHIACIRSRIEWTPEKKYFFPIDFKMSVDFSSAVFFIWSRDILKISKIHN